LPNPRCLPHAYTPPETAGDQAVSGGAGDVFSLGRIAYALFNGGALPDNPGDQTPPKDAPPWLAEIILRACQPAPALRWASLRHFCDALESHCVPAMPVVAMPVMPVVGIPKAPASAPPAPAEGGTASAAPENAEPESETREDHLSPEEMTGLYPALTPYFAVFDAQRSQTFRPPKAQARETMQMQIINRKKGLPWALIAAAACAAAVILYAVLTVILGLPTIG
ncbi:MAG: hypothetical protein FWG93_08685, partial [Oscillospiraceae bacterium]|nr:hypothetical protein [Oscillospiraceae bacterium]